VTQSLGLQPIVPSAVYPLPVFKKFTGWGDKALRLARQSGLRVVHAHSRAFVRGSDAIAYFDLLAESQSAEPSQANESGHQ
jgi:hypothetical protein